MGYETQAGRPTKGLAYAKLLEQLHEAQDSAALLAVLYEGPDHMDRTLAKGWLGVEELLKRLAHQVTELAKGSLNS